MTTNDRTEPGVCPECKGLTAKKPGQRYYCSACKGTGQQPAQPAKQNWTCSHCGQTNSAWARECGRCEYSRYVMQSGKLVERDLDARLTQPGSGEVWEELRALMVAEEIIPYSIDDLCARALNGWKYHRRTLGANAEIVLRQMIEALHHFDRLQSALTAAQRENEALRSLAANLQPGPISEALSGQRYTTETELRGQLTAAQQRIAALHASLRTYGWHKPECDYMQEELPTCGFMDAIKEPT